MEQKQTGKDSEKLYLLLQEKPGSSSWLPFQGEVWQSIRDTFHNECGVAFEFFRSTGEHKDEILHALMLAMDESNCPFELEAIHIILTELIQNGIKANFKKVYFKQQQVKTGDEHYKKALPDFKKEIASNTDMLADLAHKENMSVRVHLFAFKSNSIKLRVINNTPLYPIEAKRIQEKMANALRYETLIDFLGEQQDQTEGSGMGIFLVVHTLRSLGLSPNHFAIFQDEYRRTVASVLFSW